LAQGIDGGGPMGPPSDAPNLRGKSFVAVGRASLGAPAGSGHEAQHRAYLQALQERTRAHRQQQEAERQKNAERIRREQGFNACFSGANARVTPTRQSRSGGGLGKDVAGAWRQWEPGTVEIRGNDGEVYAIRPTGERRAAQAGDGVAAISSAAVDSPLGSTIRPLTSLAEADADVAQSLHGDASSEDGKACEADTEVPLEVDEALRATLGATQQDLQSLLQKLSQEDEEPSDTSPLETEVAAAADAVPDEAKPPQSLTAAPQSVAVAEVDAIVAAVEPVAADRAAAEPCDGGATTPTAPPCAPPPMVGAAMLPPLPSLEPPSGAQSPESPAPLPSPSAEELAARIARLPRGWKGALLRLLEDAEAEAPCDEEASA